MIETHTIRVAIEKGINFLISNQLENGGWEDFCMSPGPSGAWVSAYIGFCLREVFKGVPRLLSHFDFYKIKNYLDGTCMRDWGWGYNEKTRSDADTTAYAVLFLMDIGVTPKENCWKRLIEFRRSDGGFATLDARWEGDNWGNSHEDVTPTVLRSLFVQNRKETDLIYDGIEYIKSHQLPSGFWPAYWWDTFYYSTNINVQFLELSKLKYDKKSLINNLNKNGFGSEQNPFHLSQLLEILIFLGFKIESICNVVRKIIQLQDNKGFWVASPFLRETIPTASKPWLNELDSGSVASDNKHIFTTGSVIKALSLFLRRLKPGRFASPLFE